MLYFFWSCSTTLLRFFICARDGNSLSSAPAMTTAMECSLISDIPFLQRVSPSPQPVWVDGSLSGRVLRTVASHPTNHWYAINCPVVGDCRYPLLLCVPSTMATCSGCLSQRVSVWWTTIHSGTPATTGAPAGVTTLRPPCRRKNGNLCQGPQAQARRKRKRLMLRNE